MKTLKIFAYMFALACFSGAVSSCSSDDVEDNGEDVTPVLPAISGAISVADGNDTRGSMKYNSDKTALKLTWYADDYVWAYSPSKQFYNKLVPAPGQDFGTGTSFNFVSEGNVNYTPGERLILIYSGYKTDDSQSSGAEKEVKEITFKKRENTTLAIICGNSEKGRVFSDEGNYFFFKASSGTIDATGKLTKDADLRSYMPLLRVGIPASDAADAEKLGKLDYTIKVSAKILDETNEGFPESVTYSLLDATTGLSKNKTLAYPDKYYTWGDPYVHSLTENNASPALKSYSLWHDKAENTKLELNGYVFIPIPALNYTELNVVVTVSDPDGNSGLADKCGTYSYKTTNFTVVDKDDKETKYYTLDATAFKKEIVNRVLQLGNIWSRGTETAGKAWTFTKAN